MLFLRQRYKPIKGLEKTLYVTNYFTEITNIFRFRKINLFKNRFIKYYVVPLCIVNK